MRRLSLVLVFALPICFGADLTLAQVAAAAPPCPGTAKGNLELRGIALVPSEGNPDGAPGAMAFDYLLPGKEEQGLMFGAVVELLDGEDTWVEIPQEELAIEMQRFPPLGETERSGTRMLVAPTKGLTPGSYRAHVSAYLSGDTEVDAVTKTFTLQVLPRAAATESGEPPPVLFEKKFPLEFDSAEAAADTVGGRFPGGQSMLFQGAWTDPVTGLAYHRNRWYDPRTGQFLSPDPAGPVDSPNLYAYVGWQPTMFTDPLGLYQLDVHFYSIYYLARTAGFSKPAAQRIAQSSQYVDDWPGSQPASIRNNLARQDRIQALHFPVSEGQLVVPGERAAIEAARLAADDQNLARLGVALHTLADTFSHAGFTLEQDSRNRREGSARPNRGHADAAHGGHAPDLPYLDIDKAWTMATTALGVLQEAFTKRTGQPASPVDMQRLEADFRDLFSFDAESEVTRSAAWKSFIEGAFGELVEYDRENPGPVPPGLESGVDAHVEALQRLLSQPQP